jgi:homoserine O-acetyltransferase/O-succinyltransferase
VNVADDVIAQHRLLTEHFGIQQIQLVLGWSVGALQTYEWAIRFPDMIKRVASIAGAPRPVPWTMLWLRTVIEEPITSDPAWSNGFYGNPEAVQGGLRRQALAIALTAAPLVFYREEVWRGLGFASVDDFVRGFFEGFVLPQDPNNLLVQARKARAANPGGEVDVSVALARITAKMFVYAFTGDMLFPPQDCQRDAERIPNAHFREISTRCGHLTTFGLFEEDRRAVDDAIREALAA